MHYVEDLYSFMNREAKKLQSRMEVLLQYTLLIITYNCAIDCHFILLIVYI